MFEKTSFDQDLTQLIPRMINSNYWVTIDGKQCCRWEILRTALTFQIYSSFENPSEKIREFSDGFSIYKSFEPTGKYKLRSFLHQPLRGPHGHFDALSVTISYQNIPYVIDSGGLYKYGDPFRFTYFMSNRAHNNIIIDDKVHQSGSEDVSSSNPYRCILFESVS